MEIVDDGFVEQNPGFPKEPAEREVAYRPRSAAPGSRAAAAQRSPDTDAARLMAAADMNTAPMIRKTWTSRPAVMENFGNNGRSRCR
jgi:hypothetical protein